MRREAPKWDGQRKIIWRLSEVVFEGSLGRVLGLFRLVRGERQSGQGKTG